MVVNEMLGVRGNHRILNANPAFGKFQSPETLTRSFKDNLLLKETEPRRTNYNSHKARNYNRNYYSAAESNGEEEYETRGNKFDWKRDFMQNSTNDADEKKVSYATITLRQPLKDSNYFSDTEAFHNPNKLRIRNSSNRLQKNTASNHSLQQQQMQQNQEKQHQFLRSSSLNNYNSTSLNTNANIYNNHIATDNKFKANNLNYNTENYNSIDSSSQVPRSSVSTIRGMFDQAQITNFNRQPHGFSKLGNFYGNVQSPPQPQFNNINPHVWSPPPVQHTTLRGKYAHE